FLTPPMAMSAYYLKGVQSKNVELMEIFRGIMPFLAIFVNGERVMEWGGRNRSYLQNQLEVILG
ncbi:MAG: hypothetical protein QF364_08610, partial [Candidatus Poseidoniaceae archaeon]|nr:hypothetical protein [Candidatus Poseidoniaceae archaeon]